MLFHPKRAERLAAITNRLRNADDATANLIWIIFHAALSADDPARAHDVAQIRKWIEVGAWTDATLSLLKTELPQWKLRRLIYDESEWHCKLSLCPGLPDWLEDTIEVSSPNLLLALLRALIEAMRHDASLDEPRPPTAGRWSARTTLSTMLSLNFICCDNFS